MPAAKRSRRPARRGYVVGFTGRETAFGKDPGNPTRLAGISQYLRDLPADRYPDLVAVADDLTPARA